MPPIALVTSEVIMPCVVPVCKDMAVDIAF